MGIPDAPYGFLYMTRAAIACLCAAESRRSGHDLVDRTQQHQWRRLWHSRGSRGRRRGCRGEEMQRLLRRADKPEKRRRRKRAMAQLLPAHAPCHAAAKERGVVGLTLFFSNRKTGGVYGRGLALETLPAQPNSSGQHTVSAAKKALS